MDNEELDLEIPEEKTEETEETEEAFDLEEEFAELKQAIAEVLGVANAIKEGFGVFVENGATVKEPDDVLPLDATAGEDEFEEDEFENVLALDELDLDI